MSNLVGNPDYWFSHGKAEFFKLCAESYFIDTDTMMSVSHIRESRREKTALKDFLPCQTQTDLYSFSKRTGA